VVSTSCPRCRFVSTSRLTQTPAQTCPDCRATMSVAEFVCRACRFTATPEGIQEALRQQREEIEERVAPGPPPSAPLEERAVPMTCPRWGIEMVAGWTAVTSSTLGQVSDAVVALLGHGDVYSKAKEYLYFFPADGGESICVFVGKRRAFRCDKCQAV